MATDELLETLRQAQRLGLFGDGDIRAAADHARTFADAIGDLPDGARLIDLGSGGGLPGLVLAEVYPGVSVVLLDRRQKRTDFLERAVRRLRLTNTVVRCGDVRDVIAEVERGAASPFDVVTARGFGPPEVTVRAARALLGTTGTIVVSEPPSGDRWPPGLLGELGLSASRPGRVRRFDLAG